MSYKAKEFHKRKMQKKAMEMPNAWGYLWSVFYYDEEEKRFKKYCGKAGVKRYVKKISAAKKRRSNKKMIYDYFLKDVDILNDINKDKGVDIWHWD